MQKCALYTESLSGEISSFITGSTAGLQLFLYYLKCQDTCETSHLQISRSHSQHLLATFSQSLDHTHCISAGSWGEKKHYNIWLSAFKLTKTKNNFKLLIFNCWGKKKSCTGFPAFARTFTAQNFLYKADSDGSSCPFFSSKTAARGFSSSFLCSHSTVKCLSRKPCYNIQADSRKKRLCSESDRGPGQVDQRSCREIPNPPELCDPEQPAVNDPALTKRSD